MRRDTSRIRRVGHAVLIVLALVVAARLAKSRQPRAGHTASWTGETMGTTYSIKIADPRLRSPQLSALKKTVDDVLREVNRQMSHYDPHSELSRFNASSSTAPMRVSPGLAEVVRFALYLSDRSGGLFDPTLGPLINLWGFGPAGPTREPPSAERIEEVLRRVGARHLGVTADHQLRKDIPDLQLNLSAAAQGYGVDEIVRVLRAYGVSNAFVELGGEAFALGRNAEGRPWRVGVERPDPSALPGQNIEAVLEISDLAVATSGDYRNFFEDDEGNVYGHILDPRSGRPVRHAVASVTVIATNCLVADGLATALFVLGPEEGLKFIEAWPNAEALFIVRGKDGAFSETASQGFERLTGYRASRPAP